LDVHFQSYLFDGGVQVEGGFIVGVEVEVEVEYLRRERSSDQRLARPRWAEELWRFWALTSMIWMRHGLGPLWPHNFVFSCVFHCVPMIGTPRR
jgi:hypothetical protein